MSILFSAFSSSRRPPPSSSSSSSSAVRRRAHSSMESIYSIVFGLGLRTVVGFASHNDFKVAGPLIGLWEGVITLHFMKKLPGSFDPYIAYGVRMFIDYLVTESVSRMVLVIIWSALGMVLADVAPAVWFDVGLHRPWRRVRRDLYTLYSMTPKVPSVFPKARVVRFSRSRHSIIDTPLTFPEFELEERTTVVSDENPPPSVIEERSEPTSVTRKRVASRVASSQYTSGSEAESSSQRRHRRSSSQLRSAPTSTVRTRRATVYHELPTAASDNETVTSVSYDLDGDNRSSGRSSSSSASTPEQRDDYDLESSIESAPEIDAEEEAAAAAHHQVLASAAVAAATLAQVIKKEKEEADDRTPRARAHMYLPPTPSDSAAKWELSYAKDDALHNIATSAVPPPSAFLQQIPDGPQDWDRVATAAVNKDAVKVLADEQEKAPTPPAKDDVPERYRTSAFSNSQRTPMSSHNNSLGLESVAPEEDSATVGAQGAGGLSDDWTDAARGVVGSTPAEEEDDMYLDEETSKSRIAQFMKDAGTSPTDPNDYNAFVNAQQNIDVEALRVKEKEEREREEKARRESEQAFEARRRAAEELERERREQERKALQEQRDAEERERRLAAEAEEAARKAQEAKEAEEAAEKERRLEEKRAQEHFEAEERKRHAAEEKARLAAEKAQKKLEREEKKERIRKKKEEKAAAEEAEKARVQAEAEAEAARQAEAEARRIEKERIAATEAEAAAERERAAEAQRLAELEQKRLADEAAVETQRQADLEKQRLACEAAAEAQRQADLEQQRLAEEAAAEVQRQAELEQQRLAEQAEAQRLADLERQRLAEAEAEAQAEAQRLADFERQRLAEEAEAQRLVDEKQRLADEAAEAQRLAKEVGAEAKRLAELEEKRRVEEAAEQQRIAEEVAEKQRIAEAAAEQKRLAEEAARVQKEQEEEADRARLRAEADDAAAAEESKREEDLERTRQEQEAQDAEAARTLEATLVAGALADEILQPQDIQAGDTTTTPVDDLAAADPGTPTQVTIQLATPTNAQLTLDPEQGDADAQGDGNPQDDAEPEQSELGAKAESVVTTATAYTDVSLDVTARLQKTVSRRAQKIELEDRLKALRASVEPDPAAISHAERVLVKLDKKIQRLYEDTCRLSVFNESRPSQLTLKITTHQEATDRIKDGLLWNLTPDCTSFSFQVTLPVGKAPAVKTMKAAIIAMLKEELNIEPIADPNNGKILTLEMLQDEFDDWILDFRQRSVRGDD